VQTQKACNNDDNDHYADDVEKFIVYSDSSMREFNMKTAALEWERLGLRWFHR